MSCLIHSFSSHMKSFVQSLSLCVQNITFSSYVNIFLFVSIFLYKTYIFYIVFHRILSFFYAICLWNRCLSFLTKPQLTCPVCAISALFTRCLPYKPARLGKARDTFPGIKTPSYKTFILHCPIRGQRSLPSYISLPRPTASGSAPLPVPAEYQIHQSWPCPMLHTDAPSPDSSKPHPLYGFPYPHPSAAAFVRLPRCI